MTCRYRPARSASIQVRGDNVFAGYWGMPEKTRRSSRRTAFSAPATWAASTQRVYLAIIGRDKDLIITGGLNVYPKEIEEAIDALPGVAESAVIGLPHPGFRRGGDRGGGAPKGTAGPGIAEAIIAAN
jgi:malonyl-CoA/methylmalonyl-CoA synthetase